MRQSNSSKVSLLSLTLLIFSAGIMEIVSPYPAKAMETKDGNSAPAFLTAQVTPQVSPQATPSPVNPELGNREGGDVTLWWLLLLCLGLPFLLAWLGSKRGATTEKSSTLILTPETGQTARIYWEISPEKIQGLRRRGSKNLAIRLTDVTNINPQVTNPQLVQQVDCSLSSPLISLQVPEIDREYQAELGCVTNDGGWVSLVKSAPAYFPALHPFLGGLGAGIVTAIGSTVINSFEPQNETPQEASLPKVVDKVDVGENPVNSLNSTEDAGVIDHPAGDLEVDLWNDLSPPITADLGIEEPEVLLPKAEVMDNPEAIDNPEVKDIDSSVDSQTEDILEEMNTPLPAIVPTVDDGGNSLDWGITGGAGVVQLQKDDEVKDEIVVDEPLPRINLLPSDESTINGSWILPESIKATYQNQGGSKLALRVYDVTGIDPERSLAGTFQQFAVEETGLITPLTLQDLPHNQHNQIKDLPNTETDSELLYRDYQGELGYLTATDEWLGVAKSNRVRLPLVGETQIQLDIHTPDQGYVYWEIAPRDEQSLKSQGCRDLILRIHDSTDIDIDCTPPHTTQEYAFDRDRRNFYVSIMIGDRSYGDYLAELGYITTTGEWRRIIRSLHTRFFRF